MSKTVDFSKPLTKADEKYLEDRPWLLEDARLRGEFDPDEAETEEVDSYDDLTVEDLKAEVEARNAERADLPDTHIVVASGAKKADLVAALVADDEAQSTD